MSEFEQWFISLNANEKTVYFLGNEHKVSEMAWDFQQAIIDDLRSQLNNMEACYIEKKKQVEACVALVAEWKGRINDFALDKAERNTAWCCAVDLEEVLRGEHV